MSVVHEIVSSAYASRNAHEAADVPIIPIRQPAQSAYFLDEVRPKRYE